MPGQPASQLLSLPPLHNDPYNRSLSLVRGRDVQRSARPVARGRRTASCLAVWLASHPEALLYRYASMSLFPLPLSLDGRPHCLARVRLWHAAANYVRPMVGSASKFRSLLLSEHTHTHT